MNLHIEGKRSWFGREGLNVKFKLSIYHNIYCNLTDARGWESSGYKYWQLYKFESCMFIARTRKELKKHKQWHEQVIRGDFANELRTTTRR